MEFIRLGKTGLKVSRICLGCMSYGNPHQGAHAWTLDEEKSKPFIQRALELGINFFDTAKSTHSARAKRSSAVPFRIARGETK